MALAPWQETLVERWPRQLLRGLIHSDGCRSLNRVVVRGRTYEYQRYSFSNRSSELRALFLETCRAVGVEARPMGPVAVAVSRRASVVVLDEFIGPKR